MTKRLLACTVLLLLCVAPVLHAQEGSPTPLRQPSPGWTKVRVAKWALLGAAAGFGLYALQHTGRAQDAYEALSARCVGDPERCVLVNGRYADPSTEALYRRSNREDRRAQGAIVGGQVALFGSAALFIYDLRNDRGPRNIPYPAHLTTAPRMPALRLGLRIRT